jgi:hypothetical protein
VALVLLKQEIIQAAQVLVAATAVKAHLLTLMETLGVGVVAAVDLTGAKTTQQVETAELAEAAAVLATGVVTQVVVAQRLTLVQMVLVVVQIAVALVLAVLAVLILVVEAAEEVTLAVKAELVAQEL